MWLYKDDNFWGQALTNKNIFEIEGTWISNSNTYLDNIKLCDLWFTFV